MKNQNNSIKKCIVCGTEIVPSKNRNKRKKYCSIKCRTKDYYQKYYTHFEWKIERECKKCGKRFIPNNVRAIGCSKKCSLQYTRRKWKKANWQKVLEDQRIRSQKKAREDWKEKNCKECNKKFLPDLGHKNQQVHCSVKCRIMYNYKRAIEIGRKKKDRKLYRERHREEINRKDQEYHERIRFDDGTGSKSNNRRARLELDNYHCRRCEEGNYKKLIVHHNKYPAGVKNLITLCRKCHLYIHKKLNGQYYV